MERRMNNSFIRDGSSAFYDNQYQGEGGWGGHIGPRMGDFKAGDPMEDFIRQVEREFFGDFGSRGGIFGVINPG
jgi:hypothetical protein